jgi:hypothetical protein
MSTSAPALPAETASPTFACPGCRLEHPWAAEYVGRTARCGCGHVLKVPPASAVPGAPAATPDEPPRVPIVDEPGQVPSFLRIPAAPAGAEDALPADVEAELAAVAKYGEDDPNKPDPRRDTYVPLALLAIGLIVAVIHFGYTMKPGAAVAAAVLVVAIKLIFGMIFMLGGALLAARFAGVNFGPLGPALLKLAGLCLAPSALGDLVTGLLGGDVAVGQLGRIVEIVLYWSLVSYLFRLDGWHTVVVVGTITIVKIVAFSVVISLVGLAFGSSLPDAAFAGTDDEPAITSLEEDLKILDESALPDDDADDE